MLPMVTILCNCWLLFCTERSGLLIGDQVIEVNSISFDNIAGSSAVKVLTGSERLKVMVRRVGKVPGYKSTKEKIAW